VSRSARTLAELRDVEGEPRKIQSLEEENDLLFPAPPADPVPSEGGESVA